MNGIDVDQELNICPDEAPVTPRVNVSMSVIRSLQDTHASRDQSTEAENEYDAILASCNLKEVGHQQQPAPEGVKTRLYTITTIARNERFGGTRTPVICDSFETARNIVEKNRGDIYELSYKLCVIEAIVPNRLYYCTREQYWYAWFGDSEGEYRPIETPEVYKHTFGWGIG